MRVGRACRQAPASRASPLQVQAFPGSGRPAQAPRLLHSADSCQLEVSLVGAAPRGNRSLFGLELVTLGRGPDCPSVREQSSIDDEYTPAVFQVRLPPGWGPQEEPARPEVPVTTHQLATSLAALGALVTVA